MNVQVIQLETMHLAIIRHRGPYEGIGEAFDQLLNWAHGLGLPVRRTIGIYWDNPDYVDASQLRSAAGIEVAADFQIADANGLQLGLYMIASGPYATTRHVGPYEGLAQVWTGLTNHIENDLKRKISVNPAFEIYINSPRDTAPKDLVTELYMPLA